MDRYIVVAALIAVAQAGFGNENIPIPAIQAVQGGEPGAAATIAGAAISDLLAGTNACDKLVTADQIVAELGGGADAIAAAIGMVAAEKNTNPFAVDVPSICSDPTLPVTPELRGITPLIDPNTNNAEIANDLSAQTVQTPLDATGKSIADLLTENGFTDFTPQDSTGAAGAAAGDAAAAGADTGAGAATAVAQNAAATGAAQAACATGEHTLWAAVVADAANNSANANAANADAAADNNAANDAAAGNDAGAAAGGAGDFGTCDPTMSFEGGRGNRPADEFTFQSNDAVIAANQQEALNPNIITNRICDELGNICGADEAAIATCEDAQAQIEALGTRDQTTADAWNALVGGAAAKRSMRRGMRL
ncbi:uncharacterized protein HMPREF1541_05243 [Cyphellophora europaea CBS 101466]|uniref:Circumsporozoite protein n=1 Tax=Cyphellophora europaea (strain CBS 101466) TaxID=1220924 RepID=W2RYX0_CYPE1|nr:uncharacterized protein HMPREF1541_05243 [Cyphellophora europaea CBS 101466]ETN40963.1 hypothetical protein HMPREF1541_05243 [Cyphellophora europaea CBS 101466]